MGGSGTGRQRVRSRQRSHSLPAERQQAIVEQLRVRPFVRAVDVATELGVSVETARRDILALEEAGLARRVYGGLARPETEPTEAPFEERRVANAAAKRAIARLAVSLVTPGSAVILDIGTSVAEIARQLAPTFRGMVVTNSLLVAGEVAGRDGIDLLVAGGRIRHGDLACYGPHADSLFADLFGGVAFLGSGGVHATAGLTDHHLDEITARRVVLDHADKRYVVADSSKLGRVAPFRVCELDRVTAVLTDDGATEDQLAAFAEAGVTVLVAPTANEAPADAAEAPMA
jgi:DeoR/GlpR family transcriptional regulator of sugar metabolism